MHPVFEQSSHYYFDKLRQILRKNLKIQKASDKEAFSNMIGMNNQNLTGGNNLNTYQNNYNKEAAK